MEFSYDWNQEVIAQFYATLCFSSEGEGQDKKEYINFSIEGEPYRCSYKRFGRILNFTDMDMEQEHLHAYEPPRLEAEVAQFHIDEGGRKWVISNLKPYYRYIFLLARHTLLPK